jgi:phosphatidylglycerophosphate synthase
MTAIESGIGSAAPLSTSYWGTVKELAAAQKTAARGAPAYSRYVNRWLGRLLAAAAWRLGLSPNTITAISAVFTFTGIALLVLFPPSGAVGISVALCLVTGYALASADGQVARVQGSGSPAGERLDHIVDAVKTSVMPLALAVGLYRFGAVEHWWLLVPLGAAVVSAVLFFSMILTEQLRRQAGRASVADPHGRSWIRSVLVIPMDYGVLCLSFALYGIIPLFLTVYTLIFVATAAFLVLASIKWFRELSAASAEPAAATSSAGGSGVSK